MKDIPGFEGLYAITKGGKIWSYPKQWAKTGHQGKWMKTYFLNTGYEAVVLVDKQGKKCKFLVHRLVGLTYLPFPKFVINHKDFNRKNNSLENLEWVTEIENAWHSQKMHYVGRPQGEKTSNAKLKDSDIVDIRNFAKNKTYTYKQMANMFGIDSSGISRIVNRQLWKHIS